MVPAKAVILSEALFSAFLILAISSFAFCAMVYSPCYVYLTIPWVVFAMMRLMKDVAKRFFKDKNGRIVLWQSPNLLLYSWIALKIFSMLLSGRSKTGLEHLSTAVLFAWAYFEIVSGVNLFRKVLGAVVL